LASVASHSGLEAVHLAGRGSRPVEPLPPDDGTHGGIAGEPLGVVDVLVASETTIDRLPRRYAELCDHLRHARAHAQDRKLSLLAGALLEAVESEYDELARRPRGRWERWVDRLCALEASWLTLPRMRYLFAAVLLAMGAGAFTDLLVLLWTAILPLDLERAVYIVSGGADEPGGTRLFLLFSRFLLGSPLASIVER
jgi:hypothetical protein